MPLEWILGTQWWQDEAVPALTEFAVQRGGWAIQYTIRIQRGECLKKCKDKRKWFPACNILRDFTTLWIVSKLIRTKNKLYVTTEELWIKTRLLWSIQNILWSELVSMNNSQKKFAGKPKLHLLTPHLIMSPRNGSIPSWLHKCSVPGMTDISSRQEKGLPRGEPELPSLWHAEWMWIKRQTKLGLNKTDTEDGWWVSSSPTWILPDLSAPCLSAVLLYLWGFCWHPLTILLASAFIAYLQCSNTWGSHHREWKDGVYPTHSGLLLPKIRATK